MRLIRVSASLAGSLACLLILIERELKADRRHDLDTMGGFRSDHPFLVLDESDARVVREVDEYQFAGVDREDHPVTAGGLVVNQNGLRGTCLGEDRRVRGVDGVRGKGVFERHGLAGGGRRRLPQTGDRFP